MTDREADMTTALAYDAGFKDGQERRDELLDGLDYVNSLMKKLMIFIIYLSITGIFASMFVFVAVYLFAVFNDGF